MATLTGRMVNFLNRRLPGLARLGTRLQVSQFRASKGRKGNKLMGKPTFVLDVVGRKSGDPHPVMLMLVRRADDVIVCGSRGGHPETPNWYKNLSAAGEAHVEVGDERWAVDFRELDEGPEREECWKLLVAGYPDFASYQELTSRRLPVAVLRRKS
jgi:deazaflavin-dependent oxidoreductase (nitroreductase family)